MFRKLIDIATGVVNQLCKPCSPRPRVAMVRACPTVLVPNTTYVYPEDNNVAVKCVGEKGKGYTGYAYGPGSLVTLYAPMPIHIDLTSPREHLLPDSVQVRDHVYVYMIEDRVWVTNNCRSTAIT